MPVATSYTVQSDAGANDSDKTLTVPAGTQWTLKAILALLVTTATVGNRQTVVEIGDGTNVILTFTAPSVQAASLTRFCTFAVGLPATSTGNYMTVGLPADLVLPAGYTIRVYDVAAIDAAADDLTLRVLVDVD